MAILAIAGLSSFVQVQAQFKYRGVVKDVESIFREVRNYALTNKKVEGEEVLRYGAYIDTISVPKKIIIFADLRNSDENRFDVGNDELFKTYSVPANYKLATYNEKTQATQNTSTKPLTLFYEPTTAKFSVGGTELLINSFNGKFIGVGIFEGTIKAPTREKYIMFFKNSGSPELFDLLTEIN